MKRIFTAIDISEEVRAKASDYIKNLREEYSQIRVGWERPEKLHLTMKFLGDVDDEQLANLTAAVEATAKQFSDFKLQIAGTGVFPSKRNARILWLGVRDEKGSLQKLNEILENECEKKGFAREKRNFKEHLTIARLREPRSSIKLADFHTQNEFLSNEFNVPELIIFQSRLSSSGSQYTPVFRSRFHKPDLPLTSI
jgi:2'-5' RNA ligase